MDFVCEQVSWDRVVAPSGATWIITNAEQFDGGDEKYVKLSRSMNEGRALRKWLTASTSHSNKVSAIISEILQWCKDALPSQDQGHNAFEDDLNLAPAVQQGQDASRITHYFTRVSNKRLRDKERSTEVVNITLPEFYMDDGTTVVQAVDIRVPYGKANPMDVMVPLRSDVMMWLFCRAHVGDDDLSTPVKRFRRAVESPCAGAYYHVQKQGYACSKKDGESLRYAFFKASQDDNDELAEAAEKARTFCA